MEKTFIGIVDSSEPNEWTTPDGELVQCWKIGILLSEDRGITFNVVSTSDQYEIAKAVQPGEKVRIRASSNIRNSGQVKWRLDELIREE